MKALLTNIILLIIAIILSAVLFPIGWVYSMITLKVNIKKLSFYIITVALSIDQLGNVIMSQLFNHLLITKKGYRFGDEDDTVSYVLGRNQATNNLKLLGRWLANILDWIDKDHCKKAVKLAWEKGQKYCYEKI
jgi:8-oxo-dGTP diphosphatase